MNRKLLTNLLAAGGFLVGFLTSGCAPVTVSSTPEGANVYYKNSDKLIGGTPVKFSLYANAKEVVVRKEGYFSKTVLLSPIGPEKIDIQLDRRDRVLLLSHPSGVDLFVEGREDRIGKTPYRVDYDKPYRVFEIRAPGYVPESYTIPEDPEGDLVIKLVRAPTVMVVSKPKNVEIYNLNGKKLGVTPLAVSAVKAELIELRKEGYYPKEVTIGPETASPFVVELGREPIIIVYSEPEGATVMHRGVVLGKTPYRRLVKKDMELVVSFDRYYSKQLTIASDSPRKVSVSLEPKPYITVKSNPSNAELYRSGGVELLGTTPIEVLVEKNSAFEMHKEGFDIKPFMLSADSNQEVTVPMVQSLGSLEKTVLIDSDPSGATVYRPGGAELIGQTPLEQRVRGERTFELQLSGFKTKIVTIASDSANNVIFALAKDESARNVTISDPLLNTPSSF